MRKNTRLLIIDPQNDFCDLSGADLPPDTAPALAVQGAHHDMMRLAAMIEAGTPALSDIAITLDSHRRFDIAHPPFWAQRDGEDVAPFTTITAGQVRAGDYRPRTDADLPRVLAYLDGLEARGRYTLMIWPVHCEIGTWGHQVHAAVRSAYEGWKVASGAQGMEVVKGTNPWTEHYSAVEAEVPDSADPGTLVNRALVDWAAAAGVLIVAGEAGSHCVRATVEDLVQYLPAGYARRLVLLTDCMSPVGGFAAQQQAFLESMQARGARLATSSEVLSDLWAYGEAS